VSDQNSNAYRFGRHPIAAAIVVKKKMAQKLTGHASVSRRFGIESLR